MMYTMPLPLVVLGAVTVILFDLYTPGLSRVLLDVYRLSVLVFQSPILVTMVQVCVMLRSYVNVSLSPALQLRPPWYSISQTSLLLEPEDTLALYVPFVAQFVLCVNVPVLSAA